MFYFHFKGTTFYTLSNIGLFQLTFNEKTQKNDASKRQLVLKVAQIGQMLLTHRLKISFSRINLNLSYFSFYQLHSGRPVITALKLKGNFWIYLILFWSKLGMKKLINLKQSWNWKRRINIAHLVLSYDIDIILILS